MRRIAAAILCSLALPGCVIVQVGATNPIPGLTTVAVAPFLNLSQEPEFVANGRQMGLAYYAELQKIPGYQVIPVGVVEQAIRENNLQLSRPEDALELCRLLGCDAVVVGAITDYDPYYPPRLGLQVAWYSPYPWNFEPGMPVDPYARKMLRLSDEEIERNDRRARAAEIRTQRERCTASLNEAHDKRCDDQCAIEPAETATADRPADKPGDTPAPMYLGEIAAERLKRAAAKVVIRPQSDDAPVATANRRMSLPVFAAESPGETEPRAGESEFLLMGGILSNRELPSLTRPAQQPQSQTQTLVNGSRIIQDASTWAKSQNPPPARTSVQTYIEAQPRAVLAEKLPSAPAMLPAPSQAPKPAQPAIAAGSRQIVKASADPPTLAPGPVPDTIVGPPVEFDPRRPLMSYTRLFDAADADLCAVLRDWLELSGDRRGGTWEASLHRTDEFLRFCSHQMITEMLTLHGGDAQRRVVFKFRRYR